MTPKSRWLLIGGAVALVVAIGVTWASLASTSPQESLPLETIGTGDIEKVVLVTGVLKPAVQVNVGAQVNGQLRKLYVRQGEKVQKGQLLAEIDPTLQESDLNNTRAQLASAEQQVLDQRYPEALQNAQAALVGLPEHSADWLRAQDITMQARAALEDKKKKGKSKRNG